MIGGCVFREQWHFHRKYELLMLENFSNCKQSNKKRKKKIYKQHNAFVSLQCFRFFLSPPPSDKTNKITVYIVKFLFEKRQKKTHIKMLQRKGIHAAEVCEYSESILLSLFMRHIKEILTEHTFKKSTPIFIWLHFHIYCIVYVVHWEHFA